MRILATFTVLLVFAVITAGHEHVVKAQSPQELINLRSKDSKTFDNQDGSFTATFGKDLHYWDGANWADVDLAFRNGTSDRAAVIVDITGRNLTITERDTGIGIKYTLPENPTVGNTTLTYNHKGLTWQYDLTRNGLKLSAVVTSYRGLDTYTFPFTFLGTSGSLNQGRLETDQFHVTNPVIVDANGVSYRLNWTQDAGEIKFTFDDAGLALPYVIDPTTTFEPSAGADDGSLRNTGASYPGSCDIVDTTGASILNQKQTGGEFSNGMLRWDTSSIPDTAVVTAATFDPYVTSKVDTNGRDLVGEWYATANWPIDCSDYSMSLTANAFSEDITAMPSSGRDSISLSNLSNISLTTYTGMRTGISGGEPPSGTDRIYYASSETANDPRLVVTYIVVPSISDFQPDEVDDNGSEAVTVTGTDFETAAQLTLERAGESDIVCTGESVSGGGTQLTATCDFTGVALGFWDAVVDNGSGQTDTLTNAVEVFSVVTVTSVSPTAVAANGTKTLSVGGSGFTSGATTRLEKSGEPNINCSLNTFTDSTSIDVDCALTGAADGLWSLRVTTSGVTNGLGLSLLDVQIVDITSLTPNTALNTGTESFTIAGSGFDSGATVRLEKSGESNINCTSVVVVSLISITMDCDLTGVATGLWNLRVTNSPSSTNDLLSDALAVSTNITLVATGVASGEYTILVKQTAAEIQLLLNGAVQATYAGTAAMTDNANEWEFYDNSALPYVEYTKITVADELQLHYEMNALPGYQLVDRSGEGHNATIRFPDTPSGLTVSLSSTEATTPSNQVSAPAGAEVLGDTPSIDNFASVPPTSTDGFFLFNIFSSMSTNNLPYHVPVALFSLGVTIVAAIGAAKIFNSALPIFVVMSISLVVFARMAGIPMYLAWMFGLGPGLFFLIWKRVAA